MGKRKRKDHGRGAKAHKRTKGNRTPGESILIVCEGETEPIYFKELLYQLTGKKTLPLIDIQSAKGGHTKVTKKAKKLEKKREKECRTLFLCKQGGFLLLAQKKLGFFLFFSIET